ncbi:ABC transporter substrate-binding protein [Halobaculum litoreum]|uniref:ABC transporter substrate-binding protein n=1 Tax=Halobaculum litoreum TaxID=3031998 RepID=UPI0024C3C595|nr:extracellular solute-binding protein [Halobaculum sp. DT92]
MAPDHTVDRRTLLKLAGLGVVTSTAGCAGGGTGNGGNGGGGGGGGGGGNGGGGGDSDFTTAVQELGLANDWEQRRIGAAADWPIEQRRDVPDRQNDTTWTNSGAFQSAVENDVWAPPDGWDDTAAGDVDTMQILNHGAANMEFDPATLAAHELFTEKTGIELDVIEIGVDQANTREQQFLSSEEPMPHAFNVDGILVPVFVEQGYLEVTDALYPEGSYDPYIPALRSLVEWDIGPIQQGTHTYGYPNIGEASMGHLRPDLVEEQGIDPERFQGEWSWDLLEELGEAFAGTGVNAFAYYAGTSTYLAYSFRELLFQQGGRMVQDDGTVVMNSPEAVRVIRKMKEWRDAGYVPSDVISYGEGDIVDLYASGQLAYTTAFSDFIPRLLQEYEAGSQYQVVVPPAANAGPAPTQAGLVAPNTTSINRFSDTGHKLAAMLYGDLKLSYYTQWLEFTYEGNISYMDRVYTDSAENDFVTFGDTIGDAIENGVLELFPQMASVFQQMLSPVQRAIQGSISPQAAMDQVQDFVDSEINN